MNGSIDVDFDFVYIVTACGSMLSTVGTSANTGLIWKPVIVANAKNNIMNKLLFPILFFPINNPRQ